MAEYLDIFLSSKYIKQKSTMAGVNALTYPLCHAMIIFQVDPVNEKCLKLIGKDYQFSVSILAQRLMYPWRP